MKLCIRVVAAVAAISLSAIAFNASAGRANDITYVYYSDATHTTEIGRVEYFCGSGSYSEGEVSQFTTSYTVRCSLGTPGPPAPDGQVYTHCEYSLDPYPKWTCG
jgi:hypothetical protein